jgi:hypothetical protein
MSLIAERFEIAKRYKEGVTINIDDIRFTRNQLIAASDWTQLPDNGLSDARRAEWAAYRQALRDITNNVDINNVVWPQQPN